MSDLCSSDLGNRIIPARRIGNIQPNEERIATSSPDFGYDALGHLFIEVADYDLGAFFRETLRLSGAEPARPTRDERNLACESVSHSSSSENAQLRELTSLQPLPHRQWPHEIGRATVG